MNLLMKLAIVSGLIAALGSAEASGEPLGGFAVNSTIAGPLPEAAGQWRTRIQSVFEPTTHRLSRRAYSVWDAAPSRDLDFTWQPDDPKGDKAGRINGSGRLVWRDRSKPVYDPASVVAEYRGTLSDGRMQGNGTYVDSAGLKYEGHWHHGLMDGRGALQFPAGDEYVGQFVKGKANGDGRLIDIAGEIYEGGFEDGRRHGRGTTTLPNGASYPSLWMAGKESERSRLVRIAQSGKTSLPNTQDDVRIGIAVERRLPPQVVTADVPLWYETTNSAPGFQIRPTDSKLLKMWRDKAELQLSFDDELRVSQDGILNQTRLQLVPLNLRVELQNRSSSPIQMTGLYLNVQNSVTETKPAIQVTLGSVDACNATVRAAYSPGFTLENFGWSIAENVALKFKLANPKANDSPFNVSKTAGDLDKSLRVDIENDLKALGVDTGYLRGLEKGLTCDPKTPGQCLNKLRATGKLGRLANYVEIQDTTFVLKLAGVLEYSWRDAKRNVQNWSHPFSATLPLGFIKPIGICGAEGGNPQIITTKTQQFKLDAAEYKIPIAYQTTVAPSRTTPLVFAIEALKSSAHDFSVVIQLADGREIKSRPINLLYYRPRWFHEDRKPNTLADDGESYDGLGLYLTNYSLNGADLRQLQDPGGEKCSAACKADAKCVGFTLDDWSGLCSLKSQITSMRHDPRVNSRLKKEIKRPPVAAAPLIIERFAKKQFDNFRSYLAGLNSTIEECEQSCKSDQDCSAYNFVSTTKVCFLFDQGVSRPSANPATDSGIKFQAAQ